jgi:hypothetical protein
MAENKINKLIGAFFDSYNKGLEDHFRKKVYQRNPALAARLTAINKSVADLERYLKTLPKDDTEDQAKGQISTTKKKDTSTRNGCLFFVVLFVVVVLTFTQCIS